MKFVPKIGLEMHAELKTKTKMFCNSPNDPDEKHPNMNVCPICTGYPGVLPVINKEAVKSVLRVGLALGGKPAGYSQFDRKNYFYPDLPKGYQISQYKYPLVTGGTLNGIRITRIHLEEDAGKLIHRKDCSLIDFNRAGVPLMELVTEPDISSSEEARAFAEELRLLLRYLDVSSADMEKGQLRVEVNVSLMKMGLKPAQKAGSPEHFVRQNVLGTKVEVKNLNSFRAVEQAIQYEIKRQEEILTKGEKIIQETRGWDETKQKTFSQRSKEEAHDYRYFPEPDLPSLEISKIDEFKNLENTIPELPWQKRKRFEEEYKLEEKTINILAANEKLASFFENAVSESKNIGLTVNYLTSDLLGLMKDKMLTFEDLLVTPENFADLISMIKEGKISSRAAKDILKEMTETGAEPHVVIKERGLEQTSNEGFIEPIVQKALVDNPKAVEDYKKGKESAVQFLIGIVMKETRGRANPQKAKEVLERLLRK